MDKSKRREANFERERESSTLDIPESGVSLQQLLAQAIKSEIEVAETYRHLLGKDLSEKASPKVQRLVEQEEEHEENYEQLLKISFLTRKFHYPTVLE